MDAPTERVALHRAITTMDPGRGMQFYVDGDIVVIEKAGHRDGFYED
jgi:hypothetical protein